MSIRPETDDMIIFLNDLLRIDPYFMTSICEARIPCNKELASHPTVQVQGRDGKYICGILGVLNGFCGAYDDGPRNGWGPITAFYNDGVLTHFQRTENQ